MVTDYSTKIWPLNIGLYTIFFYYVTSNHKFPLAYLTVDYPSFYLLIFYLTTLLFFEDLIAYFHSGIIEQWIGNLEGDCGFVLRFYPDSCLEGLSTAK